MSRYLVYRIHRNPTEEDINPLYGWSDSKDIIKAFMSQRDNKKYVVKKVREDDIGEAFSEVAWDDTNKINYLPLQSVTTGETVCLFMTLQEMQETEKHVQRYFRELANIIELSNFKVFDLYINLKSRYIEALGLVGFDPNIGDDFNGFFGGFCTEEWPQEWEISQAYQMKVDPRNRPPGLETLTTVASKIIYSLESFIKVMRDDL